MIIKNESMTKKDFEQIAKIWLESNIEAHSFIDKKYWIGNLGYVKNSLAKAELLAYKVEDEIQGFVGVTSDYIEGLFVTSDHRQQGIGRQLLEELKNTHDTLKLFVYKKNENALNFYLSKEFEIFSEEIEEETGELNVSMVWKKERDNSRSEHKH